MNLNRREMLGSLAGAAVVVPRPDREIEFLRSLARYRGRRADERAHAEAKLVNFVRQGWHVLEPQTPYVHGWHIDALGEHLEAVSRGWIRNLLVNVPPRHAKSLLVAVFWPCWTWSTQPWRRWIFASYADSLSIRDSVKCRRLIQSPWYQRNWGSVFQLTGDQNEKRRFENTSTGFRVASSVGGTILGEGGDFLIGDDPNNVKDRESDVIREGVNQWWDEVMSTRGNNPKTVGKVVVQQRSHENDLSGHLLERGGWEHLCLPAEYEA
jgi:hypothetical protein